jgi:hypothetical protein
MLLYIDWPNPPKIHDVPTMFSGLTPFLLEVIVYPPLYEIRLGRNEARSELELVSEVYTKNPL